MSELREYNFVLAMGRRSHRASQQGIQTIKKTLKRKKWSQTYLAGAVNCSRQTIWSLLQGNPIDCDVFMEVCTQLEMNWEEIAEPEVPEQEQNDSQDIDALVREVRSCAHADTEYMERIGTMRMLRVNHSVPVTEIYVDLNILKRVSSDFSFSDWGKECEFDWRSFDRLGLGQVEQERVPAIEKIRDYRKLMVLGKPGAGKSTLLKSIASKCIKPNDNQLDERWLQDYIPVFITLERLARKSAEEEKFSIRDAIQRQFDHWGMAEAAEPILKQGRLLILMDGLDEVPTRHSESVIWKIRYFCEEDYAANRFIITCRTQSLKSRFEGFTEVEIADFTPEQVARFIQNWFAVVVGNAEAAELAERLIRQLQQNKPIAELAVTPILLNLTCSVFRDERGKLPTKRAELYEKGLKDLLQRLARPEALGEEDLFKRLTPDDKENLLAQVAYTLFEDNEYFPEQHKLERLLANHPKIPPSEAEQVLRALESQHGLIIERSEGYFSFSHLTFQEYFAAKYIVNSSTPEEAFQHLVKHITEPRWREVFLLTIGMLPNAEHLLQLMKQQADALVAANEKVQQFLKWVSHRAISVDTSYKPVFVRALCLNPGREGVFIPSEARNLGLSLTFDFDRIRDVDSLLVLARKLDCIYYLADACASTLAFDHCFLATNRTIHSCFDISYVSRNVSDYMRGFSRKLQTDQWNRERRDSLLTCQLKYKQSMHDQAPTTSELYHAIRRLTHDLTHNLTSVLTRHLGNDLELKQKLQDLKNQLPDLHSDTYKWWQERGQAWTEQLKLAIVKHCNNGRDWLFSAQQKELLNQYYDANRLLVDCLNSSCEVSSKVRQEIEETLLLPIEEIKKRRSYRDDGVMGECNKNDEKT